MNGVEYPAVRLAPDEVQCTVCGQPGLLVPNSSAGNTGPLVRHRTRVAPCRQVGLSAYQHLWLKVNGFQP